VNKDFILSEINQKEITPCTLVQTAETLSKD
jgi:hypothetical protein